MAEDLSFKERGVLESEIDIEPPNVVEDPSSNGTSESSDSGNIDGTELRHTQNKGRMFGVLSRQTWSGDQQSQIIDSAEIDSDIPTPSPPLSATGRFLHLRVSPTETEGTPPIPRLSLIPSLSENICESPSPSNHNTMAPKSVSSDSYDTVTSSESTCSDDRVVSEISTTDINDFMLSEKHGLSSNPDAPLDESSKEKESTLSECAQSNQLVGDWKRQTCKDGSFFYMRSDSNDRWWPTQDEHGQMYYFEENSQKTAWQLPDVSPQKSDEKITDGAVPEASEDTTIPKDHVKEHAPETRTVETVDRKSREKNSSILRKIRKDEISGPVDHKLNRSEKHGTFYVARMLKNIQEVPKKKTKMYAILTGPKLLLYKDKKSAIPKVGQAEGTPEISTSVKYISISDAEEDPKLKHILKMNYEETDGTTSTYFIIFENAVEKQAWRTALQYAKNWVMEKVYSASSSASTPFDRKPSIRQRFESINSLSEEKQSIIGILKEFFRRRPTPEDLTARGILKDESVFGSTLAQICENERTEIPFFVIRCIHAIEHKGVEFKGIYRVNGNGATIQKLRYIVDQGQDYILHSGPWNLPDLTGALKLFFRELREPLVPYECYDPMINTINSKRGGECLTIVKKIIQSFPKVNYQTSVALFHHLYKVLQKVDSNQMQSSNIAIIFGPNLLWPRYPASNLTTAIMAQCQTVEYLLNHTPAIFDIPPT